MRADGCPVVVAQWQSTDCTSQVSWVRFPVTSGLFTSLYFRLITFKHEARVVSICILIGCCKICVCLFYIPPNSSLNVLDRLYSVLCSSDVALYSHFFLMGDFSIDLMSPNHTIHCKLLSITSNFVLTQVVSELTHFSHVGVPSMS